MPKRSSTSPAASYSKRTRRSTARQQQQQQHQQQQQEQQESSQDEPVQLLQTQTQTQTLSQPSFSFSQQIPDVPSSQTLPTIRPLEQHNFESLSSTTQDQMTTLLSRHLLLHALNSSTTTPLDRLKVTKEAWAHHTNTFPKDRVSNAALERACTRIKHVFGMTVRKLPEYMAKMDGMPAKYRERLYVINSVEDDDYGTHSKALHGVHVEDAVEKGLLMLVLAFVYCKGEMRKGMRWLGERDLYKLLNSVDENIPSEPCAAERTKGGGSRDERRRSGVASTPRGARRRKERDDEGEIGVAMTPDVDVLLDKYVHQDYLIKKKPDRDDLGNTQTEVAGTEGDNFLYAIGPRAAMEIGRKQIICFCAEILEEQPDPTMLAEIEDDDDGDGDGDGDASAE